MDRKTYKVQTLKGYWRIVLLPTAVLAAIFALCWMFHPADEWLSILIALLMGFLFICFCGWLCTLPRYRLKADAIQITLFGIPVRRISLVDYPVIVITNAVLHPRGSGYLGGAMPLIDREKTKQLGHRVCFPYFVAVSKDYPPDRLLPGSTAADVYAVNWYHAKPIGLCDPEALNRIRKLSFLKLYVQPDVLAHYPELFADSPGSVQSFS